MTKQKDCKHKDTEGKFTYQVIDDRCDTDRGLMGCEWAQCIRCEKDITKEVDAYYLEQHKKADNCGFMYGDENTEFCPECGKERKIEVN